ncbi:glycosyltransferase [Streptosporangium sp. NPDC006013]|uniref:glycosyltransferase n=1 Tax=Streptosporangium sp. NPDC006013 TaxID=3155596 RepID=UPI00339F1D29
MTARDEVNVQRVVLVTGHLGLGGAEKQLSLLARELCGRGIEAHVFVLSKGGPHEASLRDAGVEVHHLGFSRRPSGSAALVGNLRAFAHLVKLLKQLRPDVLHGFLYESYVLGSIAARLARVPVVVAGRRTQGYLKPRPRWYTALEKAVTGITDHVIANAVAVAEGTCKVERVPSHKVSVIYNGLPASAFEPAKPENIDTALPMVLCVARLSTNKGHRFLIDAAALLSRDGHPCTFVLVGDGAERKRLQRHVNELGVDVRFIGFHTNIEGFLARADVVVLPSISEGLSNAVMEAMAAGRPIVATRVGGTPELLEGRGILAPPSDPAALAEGIARLLDDPELAVSLGAAARVWARKNLDMDVITEEHINLYHQLMKARCAK